MLLPQPSVILRIYLFIYLFEKAKEQCFCFVFFDSFLLGLVGEGGRGWVGGGGIQM